jgi:aminomethyltransferase
VHLCAELKLVSDTYDLVRDAGAKPPILTLPLDTWHRERGGRMVEFAGYHMPVQYEGIMAEHQWTRAHAGLFDVSHMGQLVLRGDNVAQALESLLPGAFTTLKPGKQRYSLLLADDGGVLDDLIVTNRGDDFYVVVNGATKHADIAHIAARLPGRDAGPSGRPRPAGLAGAGSGRGAGRAGPGAGERCRPHARCSRLHGSGALPVERRGAGRQPVGLYRRGWLRDFGPPRSRRGARRCAVGAAGGQADRPGRAGSLRLEAGLPLYGHDLSPDIDPVEADLGFAIPARRRVADAGYPGAARLAQAFAEGTARRRVGLLIEGRMAAREGAEVLADGRTVGTVTSGGFAPSLERPIAMAFVETALAVPGTA